MNYIAKDGKRFPDSIRGRRYDNWLAEKDSTPQKSQEDVKNAPGGPGHLQALKEHGLPREVRIINEGGGRHRVISIHQDGYRYESVHPEAFRAFQVAKELKGIEEPPALQTHARSRSQPTGPKEKERIDKEDQRDTEEET